mmetsp:Transcript_112821/g.313954  ORF Transcript_112821/g.313954 Transcript_112821/m.313954 type:complete len:117 (+) Transcript_112821:88-438(+)
MPLEQLLRSPSWRQCPGARLVWRFQEPPELRLEQHPERRPERRWLQRQEEPPEQGREPRLRQLQQRQRRRLLRASMPQGSPPRLSSRLNPLPPTERDTPGRNENGVQGLQQCFRCP